MAILTPDELALQLRALAAIDPTGWNESDVREDFIAPLLALLGYQRGTDYNINREHSHALSRPFLLVGRKRVEIDYKLVVYRKAIWIIEAKGAEDREIGENAIFQAYFYALHPEVGARYFCVINGWRIQVFDVRTIGEEYTPILDIAKEELPSRFSELVSLLGANKIRGTLQERILDDVRQVLATEIQEDRLKTFQGRVQTLLREVGPIVEDNRRAVFGKKLREADEEFRKIAEDGSPGQLIRITSQFPRIPREFDIVFETLKSRLRGLSEADQVATLKNIGQTMRGRPTIGHRLNLTRMALRLADDYDERMVAHGQEPLRQIAAWAIHAVLSKYAQFPLYAALARLEANAYRVFYKASYVESGAAELFQKLAQAARENLPEEDLVYLMPSASGERVRAVERLASNFFDRVRVLNTPQLEAISVGLEAAEQKLAADFVAAFSRGSGGDLSFYESYGVPWDYDVSGLAGITMAELHYARPILTDETIRLLVERMNRRAPDYAVNHVDCLLAKYLLALGRFTLMTDPAELSPELLAELAPSLSFHKVGMNNDPLETRMSLRSKPSDSRLIEIDADLELGESPRLRLLSARVLR